MTSSTEEPLPYWLVNVPRDQWPEECPEFLVNVNEKDRDILSTPDSKYHVLTWLQVRQLIETNRIDKFQRVPSELRKYLQYTAKLKKDYGSILNFVVKERLRWTDLAPRSEDMFQHDEDIKILHNDWPYGIDPRIAHLVVWTKFDLEDDPATDDLTPRAREAINEWVNTIFRSKVSPENVIWFKNGRSLKSVHAVEHFHIMLNDPDSAFVKEITNGDIPLVEKV